MLSQVFIYAFHGSSNQTTLITLNTNPFGALLNSIAFQSCLSPSHLPFEGRKRTIYFHPLRKLSSKKPSSGPYPLLHCFSSCFDCLTVILLRQAPGRGLQSLLELFLWHPEWTTSTPHTPPAHIFAYALHLFPLL